MLIKASRNVACINRYNFIYAGLRLRLVLLIIGSTGEHVGSAARVLIAGSGNPEI